MATEQILITINERGARTVSRNIKDIGVSSSGSYSAVNLLKSALLGLGAAFGIREIIQAIDLYTQLENRLRIVTSSSAELRVVQKELLDISNKTRSSFASNVELFARVALATRDLGVSQRETLEFTESLNKAIIVSGASSVEANAALIQLSQGLASGTLRGDELRSVLEQLPAVADVIAKGLGVTRGELRKMGEEGKITSGDILSSFKEFREEIDENFRKTIPTMGQALQVLKNQLFESLGQIDKTTSSSRTLASFFLFLSDNIDTVVRSATALAIVFGTALAAKAIGALLSGLKLLSVALLSNPILLVATAVTTAGAALVAFGDQVTTTSGVFFNLQDVGAVVFDDLAAGARGLAEEVASAVLGTEVSFDDLLGGVDLSLEGILRGVGDVGDTLVNTFLGAYSAIVEVFSRLPTALGNFFIRALNNAAAAIEKFLNFFIDVVSEVGKLLQIGTLNHVNFGRVDEFSTDGRSVGEAAAGAFISVQSTAGTDYVQSIFDRAERRRSDLDEARGRGISPVVDLSKRGENKTKPPEDKELAKKLKREADEFDSLVRSIDPVVGAQRDLADAEKIFQREIGKGNLTVGERDRLMGLYRASLQDTLDPMGAVNRELQRELDLLGVDIDHREARTRSMEIEKQLLSEGVVLSREDLAILESRLQILKDATDLDAKRVDIQKELFGDLRGMALAQAALNQLYEEGAISQEQYVDKLRGLKIESLETSKTVEAGFERGLLKLETEFSDFSKLSETAVVNAFSGMEDALVSFVTTGKAGVADLARSIAADFARIAIRQAVILPLLKAVGVSVTGFAEGGLVPGFGGPRSDNVPAMLSPGEFVVNADATREFLPLLRRINARRYADGGLVGGASGREGRRMGDFAPNITVQVQGGAGGASDGDKEAQGEAIGRGLEKSLHSMFREWLRDEQRPGGQLNDGRII